jgi:integrase
LSEHRQEKGVVFGYHGQPIRIIKTTWRTALRSSGIRHVRFHDLRHSFNTRLMEAGVMREVRMALMGHSSGRNVQSIYTHVELRPSATLSSISGLGEPTTAEEELTMP